MTMATFLERIRLRLNDPDDAQWSVDEKRAAGNSAWQRTLMQTMSYQGSQSATVVAGTHTYDVSPVIQPLAVRLGDNVLAKVQKASIVVIEENWDALPFGMPTRWIPIGGSNIRVTPTPSAGAAGIIGAIASTPTDGGSGYEVGDVLTVSTGNADAEIAVVAVDGSGQVTAVALNSRLNSEGKRVYVRGTGYSVGAGQGTTGGMGAGCTIEVTALAALEVYGPASVDDLTSDSDEFLCVPEGAGDEAILQAAAEELWAARPNMPAADRKEQMARSLWLAECAKIERAIG